jgi:hypothetical protein
MLFQDRVRELERELDDFDPTRRRSALAKLAALRIPCPEPGAQVNLHMHTFFSYNAHGWSPSRFAWEARRAGLYAAGIIDFDGLDGVGEFLAAGETLGLRVTAGIEVRTFLDWFGEVEIDSPGEPGVHYLAGSGFVRAPAPGTPGWEYLQSLRRITEDRSRDLIARINARYPEIALDFDAVARARTPAGYPTERHIAAAYAAQSREAFPDPEMRTVFWSGVLALPLTATAALQQDAGAFEEWVRSRLMKRGGPGYVQPGRGAFPPAGEVYAWVRACGAVPMDSWLDGTSAGESRASELLELNRTLGARALNLIPDRNWNVKDAADKRRKLANLQTIIELARRFHMPLHIGTEGNKPGLPFADDLARPELAPYQGDFLRGARILIGHAVLARFADFPYAGAAAEAEFSGKFPVMNAFFGSVGALPAVDADLSRELREMGPSRALGFLRESARKGRWAATSPAMSLNR